MLFTQKFGERRGGTALTGMVNHVVPLEELRVPSQWISRNAIARTDPWALRLAKRAVNHTLDTMGFSNAIESCFDMHHLGHTRALAATGGQDRRDGGLGPDEGRRPH